MEQSSSGSGSAAGPDGVPAGLFAGSPSPTLIVDSRTRRIAAANRAFALLVGRLPGELDGLALDEIDAAQPAEIAEYLLLALAAHDDGPRRRAFQAWDGSEVPVEVRAAPLDSPGVLLALHVTDLREERRLEEEVRSLRAHLLMAERHETVGRVAAVLAQDFRNLLSVVSLTAGGLRDRLAGDPDALRELDVIADIGARAGALTAELADFAVGKLGEPRPVALNGLIDGMRALLRRALPEDVEIGIRLCEGQAAVSVDPARMQHLLLHLAVAAREAMPEGGHLVIATHEVEVDDGTADPELALPAGPYVLLTVSDTGRGIDLETRMRIFDPFQRPAGGRDSGAGLATVHRIVTESGGDVRIVSAEGAGTTFRIHLPRLEEAPVADGGEAAAVEEALPHGTEHILLVEDDEAVRRATAKILEGLGYTVTQAASPDVALLVHDDLWPERGRHPVDLVLTDVIMPGMSGVEMVRRIRTKREDLRVVYMSGYLEPVARASGEPLAGPYLAKPLERERLARTVREALDGAEHGA